MITNRTFSPILYGMTLVGAAFVSGAYVQSTADPERFAAATLSSEASLLAWQAVTSRGWQPSNATEWTTQASALQVIEGPQGLFRGIVIDIAPNPCATTPTQADCTQDEILHVTPVAPTVAPE